MLNMRNARLFLRPDLAGLAALSLWVIGCGHAIQATHVNSLSPHEENQIVLAIDRQTGAWSCQAPASPGLRLLGTAPVAILADGSTITTRDRKPIRIEADAGGAAGARRITWEDPGRGVRIVQTVTPRPGDHALMVQTELTNIGSAPQRLTELRCIDVTNTPDCRFSLQGDWRRCGFYIESNQSSWAGVKRLGTFKDPVEVMASEQQGAVRYGRNQGGVQESWGGVGVIHDPAAGAFCCSALSWKRTLTVIWMTVGRDGPESFHASSQFNGLTVAPGVSVQAEPLWLAFDRDPLRLLERYGEAAGAYSHAKIWPDSPMGFMSWYATRTQGGVDLVLRNADFVKKRYAGYPFQYCHWGHGWQWKNELGNWYANEEKNPRGLAWLSNELNQRGLQLGLFCPFFCVTDQAPVFREHPDWFSKNPRSGKPYGENFAIWEGKPPRMAYFLDPTHPEVQRFVLDVVRRLKRDGCKFWLFDFGAPFPADAINYDKTKVPGQECLRLAYDMILPELDKDDFVYLCSCPTMSFVGQAHCVNGVSDIGGPGSAFGPDFQSNMSTLAARWYAHRRLWISQPDALIVGLPGTLGEAQIRASFVGLCGGVFFLSEDLPAVPEERLALAEKVMPPYGAAARPIDLFTHPYPEGYPQIWDLKVSKDWDEWHVVGLMNSDTRSEMLRVNFKDLGLDPEKEYLVREFWTGQDLGRVRGGVELSVPGHDARVLCVREVRAHPWVAGSDLHLSQGGTEIERASWDEQKLTLKLELKRRAGASGHIFIAVPQGYTTAAGPVEHGSLALKVDFPTAAVTREIKFGLMP